MMYLGKNYGASGFQSLYIAMRQREASSAESTTSSGSALRLLAPGNQLAMAQADLLQDGDHVQEPNASQSGVLRKWCM